MKYLINKNKAKRQDYKVNTLYSSAKWRKFRQSILRHQGGECVHCGNTFVDSLLHIDHITPIANGGPVYDIDNLQVLCKACHGRKTASETLGAGSKSQKEGRVIPTPNDSIHLTEKTKGL